MSTALAPAVPAPLERREPAARRPAPLVRRLALPLWRRWQQGEGGLAAANVCWILLSGAPHPLADAALSVAALGVVYAFNDGADAAGDLANARKDRPLALLLLDDRRRFFAALTLSQAALTAGAWALHGPAGAVSAAALFTANALYSLALKGAPGLDVAAVAACGAAYAGVAGAPPTVAGLAAAGAAVCHFSQMALDRTADRVNGVSTAAVRSGRLASWLLAACAAALFALLRSELGLAAACTAAVPPLLCAALDEPRAAWRLNRLYFGLALLGSMATHASR